MHQKADMLIFPLDLWSSQCQIWGTSASKPTIFSCCNFTSRSCCQSIWGSFLLQCQPCWSLTWKGAVSSWMFDFSYGINGIGKEEVINLCICSYQLQDGWPTDIWGSVHPSDYWFTFLIFVWVWREHASFLQAHLHTQTDISHFCKGSACWGG